VAQLFINKLFLPSLLCQQVQAMNTTQDNRYLVGLQTLHTELKPFPIYLPIPIACLDLSYRQSSNRKN